MPSNQAKRRRQQQNRRARQAEEQAAEEQGGADPSESDGQGLVDMYATEEFMRNAFTFMALTRNRQHEEFESYGIFADAERAAEEAEDLAAAIAASLAADPSPSDPSLPDPSPSNPSLLQVQSDLKLCIQAECWPEDAELLLALEECLESKRRDTRRMGQMAWQT